MWRNISKLAVRTLLLVVVLFLIVVTAAGATVIVMSVANWVAQMGW